MILRYPDGSAGIALLLLRSSCALTAFPALAYLRPASAGGNAATIVSSMIAMALVAGFSVRMAALLLGAALVADLFSVSGKLALFFLSLAGGAGALVLLGAGAYSLDALRYGRRVIRLELRSPDQGNPR
jgi:uncharacterized membrane protein YphA (DoxX/SURF4 family)